MAISHPALEISVVTLECNRFSVESFSSLITIDDGNILDDLLLCILEILNRFADDLCIH